MADCLDASAINYGEVGLPCQYVEQVEGVCYLFEDITEDQLINKSFTLSYAIDGDNWVFYHDYIPDYYYLTRQKLFDTWHGNQLYEHNRGDMGDYHNGTGIKPFFIDIIFNTEIEATLNSLSWVTEILTRATKVNDEFSTLTHITIWNSWQATGRISLASVFETLETNNVAKTKAKWTFNDFRDLIATRGTAFLGTLFENFAIDPTVLDANLPWYEQRLLEDDHFIVRFEFDNSANKDVILHEIDVDVTKSYK